ncbi:MAG: 3'-5' exonuclease [Patescibacteria group bacterium]
MKKHKLAFVDIETTGLDPFRHEIVEIGIVLSEQKGDLFGLPAPRRALHSDWQAGKQSLELISEHELLLRPEHVETADPKSLGVAKYDKHKWEKAVSQKEGIAWAAMLLQGTVFVAQNVSFDWGFLRKAGNEYGVDFEKAVHYHKLDLASMVFGKLYHDPKLSKFTLREMTEYFGVKNENAHTALADARATFEVCKRLLAL